MELELIECRDGLYAVDWTLVDSIIRSNLYATALLSFSKEEVTESGSARTCTIGPSTGLAFAKRRAGRPNSRTSFGCRLNTWGCSRKSESWNAWSTRPARQRTSGRKKMQAAQNKTMANIDRSVSRGEFGLEVAKSVRDVSGGVLVVGATVLSGGTLAGLTGAAALGGGINAATKFQDTGNGAAATFAFVTGFTINLIPGAGAGAKASEKVIMFLLKAKFEAVAAGGQALIEGKTAEEAVVKSLESVASGALGAGAGHLLKTQAARKLLGRSVYPATMKIDFKADTYLNRLRGVRDLTHGMIKAPVGEGIKRGVELGSSAVRTAPRNRTASRPVLDNAIIIDEMLLNKAVQGPNKSEFRPLGF